MSALGAKPGQVGKEERVGKDVGTRPVMVLDLGKPIFDRVKLLVGMKRHISGSTDRRGLDPLGRGFDRRAVSRGWGESGRERRSRNQRVGFVAEPAAGFVKVLGANG